MVWRVWCFGYHGMVNHSLLFVWKEQEREGSNTHGTVGIGRVHTGTWCVKVDVSLGAFPVFSTPADAT